MSAAHLVSQQDDQYELVLGTGLLAWRSPSGTVVRNHVLTTRVIATVDSERDEVRVVVDGEAATRAQDRELLDEVIAKLQARLDRLIADGTQQRIFDRYNLVSP